MWPRKGTKISSDPLLKLVHDLHRDLELVYVGQICLSWEILCWQHRKIQELTKYDSQQRPHRYNLVAGEFQLFQVLMQRFIEDEPFQQESRIQNYVKNRFVIRNLLQVPPIKGTNKKIVYHLIIECTKVCVCYGKWFAFANAIKYVTSDFDQTVYDSTLCFEFV